jgi:hypothetical protein
VCTGYIFGENVRRDAAGDSQKVDMTAPVTMATQEKPPADSSEKVAMTAPVTMQQQQSQQSQEGERVQTTMAFIAPSHFKSVSELPVPKDSRVSLTEVPQR